MRSAETELQNTIELPHTRPSRNRRTAEVDHRGSGTDFALIFQKTLPAGRVFFLRVFFLSKQESFFDKNKSLFLIKIRIFFFTEMIIQLFLV